MVHRVRLTTPSLKASARSGVGTCGGDSGAPKPLPTIACTMLSEIESDSTRPPSIVRMGPRMHRVTVKLFTVAAIHSRVGSRRLPSAATAKSPLGGDAGGEDCGGDPTTPASAGE